MRLLPQQTGVVRTSALLVAELAKNYYVGGGLMGA